MASRHAVTGRPAERKAAPLHGTRRSRCAGLALARWARCAGLALALPFAVAACMTTGPDFATGSPGRSAPATDRPSAVAPSATTVPPSPPGSPSAAVSELGPWRSASDQASVRGVQFRDVVWTGSRFVASAGVPEAGGDFLDSPDGRTWHRQPGTPPSHLPVSLAAGPGGVVAVGLIDDRPGSWYSADGIQWTVMPHAFPVRAQAGDTVQVTDVVAADGGWLAVGREDPACQTNCELDPVRAIVWSSVDGLHWTAVPEQASLAGAAMIAVVRHGHGYVSVGMADRHAAAWTSSDGVTWARAADSPVFGDRSATDPSLWTTMSAVASHDGVAVAVGNDGPSGTHGPAARAWWSADGVTWTDARGEGFETDAETAVTLDAATATPDGFVAAGSSGGRCPGGLWDSADGSAWRCAAIGDALQVELIPYAVAASDFATVVVGLSNVPDPPLDGLPGAAWWRSAP